MNDFLQFHDRYGESVILSIEFNAQAYDFSTRIFIFILFIYLGFYVAFNTVQVISRWEVGRAEETST